MTQLPPYAFGILARATGGPVTSGSRVDAALDRAVLSGAAAPLVIREMDRLGSPWDPSRLVLAMDFLAPEVESEVPRSRATCRDFADRHGVTHVYDLNMGIGSHVAVESSGVTPGQLVVGSGRCLGVLGGVGTLGLPLQPTDLAQALVTGRTTLTVPEVVPVRVTGRLPRWAGPWDLAVAVRGAVGERLAGALVEISGEIQDLPVDLRVGLCGLLGEMGAHAALVVPDERVVEFLSQRGTDLELDLPTADPGTSAGAVEVDLGSIHAMVATAYRGSATRFNDEEPIQGVFVGSCYGGRYEDLALVAEVLKKEGRVHPRVRLAISPATLETARACLQAGFHEIFLQAGAMIAVPGGGSGSAGGGALFGEGERIASTAEYHRQLDPGQGVPEVRIVSPAAAAVAAATGRLTDPSRVIS